MSATIKSAEEIEKMREAGRLAAQVLEMIEEHVKVGVTTQELDDICHTFITETQSAIPAPLNYHGFPKSICTSINHIVCHGIPNQSDVLKDGDIINIDITVIKDGYHGDTSKMFLVGDVSAEDKALCHVAQESLYQALKKVKPGARIGDLGTEIQKFIKNRPKRYSIVKDYCGHGIGAQFHEEPQVVHYKNSDRTLIQKGMCFTIEPMINAGKFGTVLDEDDGWTVYTVDGKKSAQWEHTILVTDNGCEILTLRSDESLPRILNNA
ncbi:type I methionyl aminopeptidase [Enterovibrio norvegicus]|uniref:Methionine aminopeptidase n=2 Tax=Enterovibrio norvegicus TaxID=188144 RepID=A0A2N7LF19_9GAMM|nr:type I methionyl aminopeptidase [Enterovibrio norvegicus]MCC4799317.1 type I methionyl aminopeptidase [Enterovibrio norvegicus]OEF51266.1 type I methionyl aminopeptidase [Enterovibrio norvegicus]OEF59010.1 type I methionyl aminopeptidase [Enterovibrio norvegicus]PMH62018.1 type I methionyl aminopeptidase [Enterovibrio norvegicus]PMI34936.1 type I methionyl aminopeptidase [Enterovibrio norvegicus]